MQGQVQQVAVHPIVLLSVVDHYNRVCQKNSNRRVIGALLGESSQGILDVTNSYAIPFEEDLKDPNIWFLDHTYHENMFSMFRKVNAKEKFLGWYTTSPKKNDIEIHQIFKNYCENAVLVVVDPEHSDPLALPTEAFVEMQTVNEDGSLRKVFRHVESTVEAFEPEEIGVESLLREIKNISLNSLAQDAQQTVNCLKALISKIDVIQNYLQKVDQGSIKCNNTIMYKLQDMFNLIPNLSDQELINSFSVQNNDSMFAIYIGSMIRSTIALHDLIRNKIDTKEQEILEKKNKENEKQVNSNLKVDVKN